MKALSANHFKSGYLTEERWISYVRQVSSVADIKPRSVIEVGVGPGAMGWMIEATFPGCRYVGVDITRELNPCVCASVVNLPFAARSFDVAFCCQVLEHLPYENFIEALSELRRVARSRVVISLPDVSPFFYLRARIPGMRRLLPRLWYGFSIRSPFRPHHSFEDHGQHHWEIGKRGYSLGRILTDIRPVGWRRVRHFRMVERWYWHFFLLDIV